MGELPKTKREAAAELLDELFREASRITITDAAEAARKRGISRRTLTRAAVQMGIRTVHNGRYAGIWEWLR
jgi:N-formylglutamate amidohydrolase